MTLEQRPPLLRFEGLRFDGLEGAPVRHALSTRPWNLSFSAGTQHGDPLEGRRRLLEFAGIDPARTVIAGQVHGSQVRWITAGDCGQGVLVRGGAVPETDALATMERGVGLLITAADCPPILTWDPDVPTLAVVHSGWRGTARGVLRKTLDALCEVAGARPGRIRVAIGPGIGACCYEVGDELVEQVPAGMHSRVLTKTESSGRWQLDLRAWIVAQAIEFGIPDENLTHLDDCTACRRDRFFSHRGEGGNCGRFGLVAALR